MEVLADGFERGWRCLDKDDVFGSRSFAGLSDLLLLLIGRGFLDEFDEIDESCLGFSGV